MRLWILVTAALPAILLLLSNAPVNAADKARSPTGSIVKWVDEKGVTHYGDNMPAQYSGRDNSVINSQGILIKRNQAASVSEKLQDEASIDEQRRDRALLATFTTEQEIDLARDRNTQMDKTAIQGLQQQLHNAKNHLAANQKIADGFVKRKQAAPADLVNDLKDNQAEIAKIEEQISQRHKSMQTTQKRFDDDKRRFGELKAKAAAREVSR
jgi:hypothetical protein